MKPRFFFDSRNAGRRSCGFSRESPVPGRRDALQRRAPCGDSCCRIAFDDQVAVI
jgi:hypothetical protein